MFVVVPHLPYDPSFHDEVALKRDKKKKQKDLSPSLPVTHRGPRPDGYVLSFFFILLVIFLFSFLLFFFFFLSSPFLKMRASSNTSLVQLWSVPSLRWISTPSTR